MENKESLQLTFVGDIFPADLEFNIGFGIKSLFEHHQGNPWELILKELFNKADIVIGNLESPLITSTIKVKDSFHGYPAFALFLKECGVTSLNIANNHILEHGDKGFEETLKILNQTQIDIIGSIENNKSKIIYKIIGEVKIAIAGFCNVDIQPNYHQKYFAVLNKKNTFNALQEMQANNADIKILNFHWGNEYIHQPSIEQRQLAYECIDAGADIIAGHHPHVIQPYEKYKEGHIFYSLGNFCFDNLQSKQTRRGMVASLSWNKHEKMFTDVNLQGIILSRKTLLKPMPAKQFMKYYNPIDRKYQLWKSKSDEKYVNKYKNVLLIRHSVERILMKLYLVKMLIVLPFSEKRKLIKNLINFYIYKH